MSSGSTKGMQELLGTMREAARGIAGPRLDSDWFAVDRRGHVAFFMGGERGPIPADATPSLSDGALGVLAEDRAAAATIEAEGELAGYRGAERRVREAVFDVPTAADGGALHEHALGGYPLLVTGSSPVLGEIGRAWSAKEASSPIGLALLFPAIDAGAYAALHAEGACTGCRVVDDPADPRPRSPEALGASGFHVYGHVGAATNPYRRIAAPSFPAVLADLPLPVAELVGQVVLPIWFDQALAMDVRALLRGG
ncbi:MAG: hypothetical protein JWP97_1992 [Labilithrix sp.]|nr:hypothetical protein [Labilithrix sp.]